MTFNEYQKLAARTINPKLTKLDTEKHALFGLAAESGEVLGLYQKELQGHTIHRDDVIHELGDILWMIAELCTDYEIDMDVVAAENIAKLKKRYPDGFDPEKSLHREENT